MHTFFNIPLTFQLDFIDDVLYATPKRDKICPCGGKRHLHHKKEQDIRHSYTYEYGTHHNQTDHVLRALPDMLRNNST